MVGPLVTRWLADQPQPRGVRIRGACPLRRCRGVHIIDIVTMKEPGMILKDKVAVI